MFKYLITAAAALLATPALAQNDICSSLGDMAETSLSQRYAGMSLSEQITILNGTIEPGSLRDMIRALIVQAYQEPLNRSTKTAHLRAFRNRWELACYEAEVDYI